MSSTQSFSCTTNKNAYGDLDRGSDIILNYDSASVYAVATTATTANSWVKYNSSGKNKLFPNATAHPIKADIKFDACKFGISTGEIRTYFGGTNVFTQKLSNSSMQTFSANGRTDSAIRNCNKNSEIRFDLAHGSLTGTGMNNIVLTLYFTRYDFSASAGSNVSSASVSRANGYDGDTVTFSCSLAPGATFDGWYNGNTRVSTSQSYVYTVNGADLSLQARATAATTKTVKVSYNGRDIVNLSGQTASSFSIAYNGATIATLSSGSKTLHCKGRIMRGNVTVAGKTLNCKDKLMASNVVVTVT